MFQNKFCFKANTILLNVCKCRLGAHIIACSKTSARIIEGKDTPEISRKVWNTKGSRVIIIKDFYRRSRSC